MQLPKRSLQVDAGTEFKAECAKFFTDNNIFVRVAQTGRHRQQALVETYNGILGKLIFMRQTAEELNNKTVSKSWIKYLPKLIKRLMNY